MSTLRERQVAGVPTVKRDSRNNPIGLNLGIDLPDEINTYARQHPHFARSLKRIAGFSAATVPSTVPLPTYGNTYYIDNLHASKNNAGAGTSPAAPWADVSNIVGKSIGGGDVINIAGGCVFDYPVSWSVFNNPAAGAFPYNGCDGIRGTAAWPVVIRAYYPRGGSAKPIIRFYGTTIAGDWTQESGVGPNIWSVSGVWGGFDYKTLAPLFGPSKLLGQCRIQGASTGPAACVKDRDYAIYGTKMYVYSVGNPVAYYGAVGAAGREVFASQTQGLQYARISGIRFEYCRAVGFYPSVSFAVGGLVVENCESYRGWLAWCSNSTNAGTPTDLPVLLKTNKIYEAVNSAIKLQTDNGTSMSWELACNEIYGANMCCAFGGGLLYTQAKAGTKGLAWGNYGFQCKNGTGDTSIDGSMLYSDVYANGVVFEANIAEQCGVAYQMNNTLNGSMVSNAAIDCISFDLATAAEDVDMQNTSVHLLHNTWLWTGRVNKADIPLGSGLNRDTVAVFASWNGNYYTTGHKAARYLCVNNLAVDCGGGSFAATKMVASYDAPATTTLLVGGFAALGFLGPQLINSTQSAGNTNVTNAAGMMAAIGSVADLDQWLDNAKNGGLVPSTPSVLQGLGLELDQQFKDMLGTNFAPLPTVGAVEAALS